MLDSARRERIAFEVQLVKKYFPAFQGYHDQSGKFCIAGWTGTKGRRNNYKLRLELSPFYPDSNEPDLIVESPKTLFMFGHRRRIFRNRHRTINSLGTSHFYHVYGNDSGYVQICYTSDWDPSCNCVMALLRGMIWIDGYENHLRTGETIAAFIDKLEDEISV